MADLLEMLTLPFVACMLMGSILGYLGMHVLRREVIFIDIAVAQVAAVGALFAHLAFDADEDSMLSYLCSLLCVLGISMFYSLARRRIVQISLEAVIGISYAITAAAALFLIGLHPGHVHAQEMLAGSLLWVTWQHVFICAAVFAAVALCFLFLRRPLGVVSHDYDQAVAQGHNVILWDFVFYALLGLVITLAVRISGVVSVFAFLIIPATTSALFCSSWAGRMLVAWCAAGIASVGGLLLSYYLDFSMGPAVAACLGALLALAAIARRASVWS